MRGAPMRYGEHRAHLARALNEAGWDGAWYRRAYYDDGTPLGAAVNDECQIDALAQAWAVISGVAPPERAAQSLDAMQARLVRRGRRADPAAGAAVRPHAARSRLHQGLRARACARTAASTPTPRCGRCRRWPRPAASEVAGRLLEMLSPASHARSAEAALRYKVEPYVVAADVYGAAPHVGRGGWTWYTGSAGWMFRVVLETVLGCRLEDGATLVIQPRLPPAWPAVELCWRLPDRTAYAIRIANAAGGNAAMLRASLDGAALAITDGAARIPLQADGHPHQVQIELG